MTLSYFVHLYIVHAVGGVNCWVCLTLDVHVSILYMQHGFTPLYFASKGGHSEVVDLLLERGAQVNKVQHCNVSMQCIITSQATMWIASSFLELM